MRWALLLTTLCQVYTLVWSGATVQFKLVSFYNPDHKELDGDCCDNIIGGCNDYCDNRFIVCLAKSSTGTEGSTCDIDRIDTARVFDSNDDFVFPATIPDNIDNPTTTNLLSWPGSMEIFVQIWDVDNNSDDKVDEEVKTIHQTAARSLSSASWQQYTTGQQSVFTFQVKVYCNPNYFSSSCDMYCLGRDNLNGHYSCDPATGAKICYNGWEGTYCNIDTNECSSSPCTNGACTNDANKYTCQCDDGWTGTNCDVDVDECASSPCLNGGTCTDGVNAFSCSCPPGFQYADPLCEYDDCADPPCLNNATCLDLAGRFECLCPHGFYGDLCEVDVDYCINQTCANNGTCVDRVDGFHCLCGRGFEGAACDVDTDECASDPCMHNATCRNLVGQYSCVCASGYEGANCEHDIDECLSAPCWNNGTCSDRLDGYSCLCLPGFQGEACQSDVDECTSSPCHDNETCVDEVNGYRCLRLDPCEDQPCVNGATCRDEYPRFACDCPVGYAGLTCAEDQDECASSPCSPGSTCLDRPAGFDCLCPPGFVGPACGSEVDECRSSPCLHGATCADLVDGYRCDCAEGYSGARCQNETDECASSPCQHGRCVDALNGYKCECVVTCDHGYCDENGACQCDAGYQGQDCSTKVDYCLSSPCNGGTCVELGKGYRCECDPLYIGTHCEELVEDPCALVPCQNGRCEESESEPAGYQCVCYSGFYGANCKADVTLYGAVVYVTGTLRSTSEFETNMAGVLQTLYVPVRRGVRDGSGSDSIEVEIILKEYYVKSTDSSPLTKVTFLAWTESGYLTKGTIEDLLAGASSEVLVRLGHDVYRGPAKPYAADPSGHMSWYYVLLLAGLGLALVVLGFIVWIMGHQKQRRETTRGARGSRRDLPSLPDVTYSTRLGSDLTGLARRVGPAGGPLVESVNPAYAPSSIELQHAPVPGYATCLGEAPGAAGCGASGGVGAPGLTGGAAGGTAGPTGGAASNDYTKEPKWDMEGPIENPYSMIGH